MANSKIKKVINIKNTYTAHRRFLNKNKTKGLSLHREKKSYMFRKQHNKRKYCFKLQMKFIKNNIQFEEMIYMRIYY